MSTKTNSSPAPLAKTNDTSRLQLWRRQDWQSLWLTSHREGEGRRTIALLPAAPGFSSEEVLEIAATLARTGMVHLGLPVYVADATRLTLAQLVGFTEEMARHREQTGGVIVALPSLAENVTAINVAQAADAVLLCVLMRRMGMADTKRTVERVGKNRILGAATFSAAGD
jgi:hypothetical protein